MVSLASMTVLLLASRVICEPVNQAVSAPAPTQTGTSSMCSEWHVVKQGDTCGSIEKEHKISHEDFMGWNPAISKDCSQNFWEKYAYCVCAPDVKDAVWGWETTLKPTATSHRVDLVSGSGYHSMPTGTGRHYQGNSTDPRMNATGTGGSGSYSIKNSVKSWVISTPSPIDMSWPPKKTQAGQPAYCNKWYLVGAGDTCETVSRTNGVSKGNLLKWNPALGKDCSGLTFRWFVCVGARAQESLNYFAMMGNTTVPPYKPYTPTHFPTINSDFTASPTQAGLATDCKGFHQAQESESCKNILEEFGYISKVDFFQWNPALQGNCDSLKPHYWYCVANFASDALPMPPTATQAPSPRPSDAAKDCTSWYQTHLPDGCETIVMMFGTFSKTDFLKWNPSVGKDCSNIKDASWYCVAVPDTPKTRTMSLPTNVQGGQPLTASTVPAMAPRNADMMVMTAKL